MLARACRDSKTPDLTFGGSSAFFDNEADRVTLHAAIRSNRINILAEVVVQLAPTDAEISTAADLLISRYQVSMQLVSDLFRVDHREQANSILPQFNQRKLTLRDVTELLIRREGAGLFAGCDDTVRKFRAKLLGQIDPAVISDLFSRFGEDSSGITVSTRMVRPLAEKPWHAGGRWPRAFVRALDFPDIFAGVVPPESSPTVESVEPRQVPPELRDFQINLKERMLEVLNGDSRRNSCVVTLPTGGGKTRVAVEAFIDWMHTRFSTGKYMVWVAQSEELCEQAIACIRQMWSARPYPCSLQIYRCFGSRNINPDTLHGGAVVASIQQLYTRIEADDPAVKAILESTGALIIDEAHRATTPMYDKLYEKAGELCGPDPFPVCGLTATPGRSGLDATAGTQKLVDRFKAYLVKPELGPQYDRDPLRYFREHRYLARARHIVCRSDREYELTDKELDECEHADDLPERFRKRLAADTERNGLILRRLLRIPSGSSTLVYACTVDHAYFLAALLSRLGRTAGVVSSDTSATVRRGLIHEFKEKRLEFLCNYGVLTTGFDAPKTSHIVLCRPTTSVVLYEQIVGRGLRGPQFGGTEECEIIDFADNIQRLGPPLAYSRFADCWPGFWESESDEG